MLSRVANSIYWMSRYTERAENIARLIHVNLGLIIDLPRGEGEQWQPLVSISGDAAVFRKRFGEATRQTVTDFLTFDPEHPSSILSSLRAARENARSIREIIPSEMWEQINSFYLMVSHPDARAHAANDPHDFYTQVRQASHLFVGICDATMTRNDGWHFARLGRLLERADKTSRTLDVKYFILLPKPEDVGTPLDTLQWASLLRSASGFEMYRKRFGRITPEHVVEFLMFDRAFPRAMLFCLTRARESLHAITGAPMGTFQNPAEQRLAQLHAELAYTTLEEVVGQGLHEFIDRFQMKLNLVDEGISRTFFDQRPTDVPQRQTMSTG